MKKLLMAAVALTALATVPATPAAAQAVFNVSGTVNAVCNYSGGTIAFGTITTNADGTLPGTQDASSTPQTGFFCNGAGTTLTLAHSAMTTSATPATGFTSTINFTPAVVVGGVDKQVGDGSGVAFGAQAGSLVVDARDLSTASATDKVMAGSYSGTITLTLTPAS
jgi:opacity protein-like surface antigen